MTKTTFTQAQYAQTYGPDNAAATRELELAITVTARRDDDGRVEIDVTTLGQVVTATRPEWVPDDWESEMDVPIQWHYTPRTLTYRTNRAGAGLWLGENQITGTMQLDLRDSDLATDDAWATALRLVMDRTMPDAMIEDGATAVQLYEALPRIEVVA